MKERIKMIMEAENMTPARFADNLQIGRAVISHILNGRNNPSLDVITRILSQLPKLNSDWLLTGSGSMYKSERPELKNQNNLPDLFSQVLQENENLINTPNVSGNIKYNKENIVNPIEKEIKESVNERIIYKEAPSKKVKQIIIYYNDNTFEAFTPGQ